MNDIELSSYVNRFFTIPDLCRIKTVLFMDRGERLIPFKYTC